MKKIAVVATEKEYADFLMDNISKYLRRYADFVSYSIPEIDEKEQITEDFVVVSAFNIFQQVREKISSSSEIVVLSLSLNKKQMRSLKDIPKGTKALLVNFDNRSCMHTITSMYNAGFREVELFPYFGEGEYDRTITTAITPNEAHLVPEGITRVYDVGESSVDMNSLYNIADKLGVYEEFAANEAKEARQEYYYVNSSMDKLLDEKESMSWKLDALLKLMNDGIIIVDSTGKIFISNEKAQKLLEKRTKVLQGFNIEDILPGIDVNVTKEKLVKSGDLNLIVSIVEIRSNEEMAGHIITIKDFEEEEEKQHGMRSKLSETNHIAKYHFGDILGKSDAINNAVLNARKIAKSDAAVMITGESGTGKEMFAQSIHNASNRNKYNFVAVNCAAIPENLLESEMFGYVEGSFTGARKGGKIGFFELAHRGTIFLDEIGEMPMHLQSKLLRVLEEKKIMRVGSNKNIDIDVRIISATNEDLFDMISKGRFREDLYYRLNVLPLKIPPLRERTEDIDDIFESFTADNNIRLDREAKEMLSNYMWRGNVRELRNVAEYLMSLGKETIGIGDLPELKNDNVGERIKHTEKWSSLMWKFILNEGREIKLYEDVLEELEISFKEGKRYGRQKLVENINEHGGFYSEGEIRKALSKLSTYGFIRSAKGRGGSVITSDGIELRQTIIRLRKDEVLG
jgi:transcriptional regulator with PAS, ATPase and Fis domain